jgi:putative flippase GtrA
VSDGHLSTGARFLGVGAVNTLAGLLVIYVAKWAFAVNDVLANLYGYAFGLLLSFVLHRRWTFRYHGEPVAAFMRFVFVTIVAYGLNLSIVLAAIKYGDVNSYLAQALGVVPYTLVTYLCGRYFVFRVDAV